MGAITWVIIVVVVLGIIGIGVSTFISGVWKGLQIINNSPIVRNASEGAKEIVANTTKINFGGQKDPLSKCDESLWNHVYNPDRLKVVNLCTSITGIIEKIKSEADGDFHVQVKPDSPYLNMINDANIKYQHGDFVVEPVCEHPVTQEDAITGCSNFNGTVHIPAAGTHVRVVGSYVLDKEHYDWAEIHPVTSITKE